MSLSVPNRNLFSNIEEINSDRTTWNIRAKIIRLWQVSDFNRANVPFSLEMVLMDAAGDKIHATINKTLIYAFFVVLSFIVNVLFISSNLLGVYSSFIFIFNSS